MDPHQRLLLEAERRLTRQARQAFDRGLGGRLASPSPLAPGEVYGGAGANIQVGSAPAGEWIHLTATDAHLMGADDVLTFDTIVARSRFDSTPGAGTLVLPRTAKYMFRLWFKWAAYLYGGTVEVEVNGTVVLTWPGQSVLGQEFSWADQFPGNAGDQVRFLVTLPDGTSATCDADLTLGVDEPVKESVSSAIVADGLIGFWTLGEASGTTAADSGPNGLDGTYQNSPTLGAAGLLSGDYSAATSVHFDPASDHRVVIPHNGAMDHNSFAVELWFRMDTLRDYNALAARTGGGTDSVATFDSYVLSTGEIRFYIRWAPGAPALYTFIDSAALSAGTTYHVVLNRNSEDDRTEIWVNGALSGSETRAGTVKTTDHPLYLGRRHDAGTVELDGRLQYVAYYSRALTEAEISEHYEAGSG